MDVSRLGNIPKESHSAANDCTAGSDAFSQDVNSESHATRDELQTLKELFFHSIIPQQLDWAGICSAKQHDFKFWANVTHALGPFILKSIFNADMPFEDSRDVDRMSLFQSEAAVSTRYIDNYVQNLKSCVSFLLLSGMIDNRLPGSLRLLVRGRCYSFFEYRINQLLNDVSRYDVEAMCFNLRALKTLFPYLQEHQPLKLASVCYKFLVSRFWRFMWLEVGVGLKTEPSSERSVLFSVFLELASVIFYGSRSGSLLKQLYTSCMKSIWDPILSLLSWSLDPKVLCRLISFIADLLLMSFQDGCIQRIDGECLKSLLQEVNAAHMQGKEYLDTYFTQTLDERNEFYHYFASIAVAMLEQLSVILKDKCDNGTNHNVQLLYELSSIGIAKMTLPPHVDAPGTSPVKFNYMDTRVFPRVLPCFNADCIRIFHIDMPQLHVNDTSLDFMYCSRCGVPSYCSKACASVHWEASHKEVCGFFRSLPTFAKFNPPVADPDGMMLCTFGEGEVLTPFFDQAGNVLTIF